MALQQACASLNNIRASLDLKKIIKLKKKRSMSLPKNILPQSKTRLVLMPPFLGLAPGKVRSTEKGTEKNPEKHIPKGPCLPHWPDFVSRITMVIFSPNTNTVNIFIYMSL